MFSQLCQLPPVFRYCRMLSCSHADGCVAPGPGAKGSDASGAAESDRDAVAVHNYRHRASSVGVLEHALQAGGIPLDVDVLELNVPPLIVGPGGLRVGSGVLPEDVNHTRIVRGQTAYESRKGSDPLRFVVVIGRRNVICDRGCCQLAFGKAGKFRDRNASVQRICSKTVRDRDLLATATCLDRYGAVPRT